jgi:hypothetical protein
VLGGNVVPRRGWSWIRRWRGWSCWRSVVLLLVARTTTELVLTPGVRLHHHWSGHRSVVVVGRCRIWRSQCRHEFLPQVEDDNILEVVDILLIRVNSWDPPIARNRSYLVVRSTAETVITLVNHIMMKDMGQGVLLTHAREQCQKRRPELSQT